MPQGFTRRAIGALLTATALLLIWRISNYDVTSLAPASPNSQIAKSGGNPRRIAKVSMLYGNPNPLYERALQSHERHAQRWGYPMYVLEQDISEGFWNKPSYVLSLVIQELAKPPGKRCEWLMSVPYIIFLCSS
jgi:ABC-type dipeptide/oligopeptide/nickel transport system permease component